MPSAETKNQMWLVRNNIAWLDFLFWTTLDSVENHKNESKYNLWPILTDAAPQTSPQTHTQTHSCSSMTEVVSCGRLSVASCIRNRIIFMTYIHTHKRVHKGFRRSGKYGS